MHVAFNSLSVSSTQPGEVLRCQVGTPVLAQRAGRLRRELLQTFSQVSMSVLPGRNLDLEMLRDSLLDEGVAISSVDAPSVKSYPEAIVDAIRQPRRAKNHIGWAITNAGSIRQQGERVRKALIDLPLQNNTIVKANAEVWIDSMEGDCLENVVRDRAIAMKRMERSISLAVEIAADKQTPGEYFAFLQRLREVQRGRYRSIGILADLDLGHLEQSRFLHPGNEIPPAVTIFEETIQDATRASMVEIVSFHQYRAGAPEAHAHLTQGDIDLQEAARLMGRGMREGRLRRSAHVLFETHPSDYHWFFSEEGRGFNQSLRRAFDKG